MIYAKSNISTIDGSKKLDTRNIKLSLCFFLPTPVRVTVWNLLSMTTEQLVCRTSRSERERHSLASKNVEMTLNAQMLYSGMTRDLFTALMVSILSISTEISCQRDNDESQFVLETIKIFLCRICQ